MTFRGGAPLDPSQVEDQRGRGGSGGGVGGPVIVGGGGIGLVILIVALLLGVNPLSDYTATGPSVDGAPSVQDCQTGADANKRDDCRIVGFVDSIQKYWGDEFARRGDTYLAAKTVLYTDATQGACGFAQAAMGPFYCPEDEKVYLDLSFFQELTQRFGAKGGPFAEGYVVAHEYGHHVQNQLGLLAQTGSKAQSIRVELQADCLAHHLRGESVADVRARIAATHGDDVARRAVITSLQTTSRTTPSKSAAA